MNLNNQNNLININENHIQQENCFIQRNCNGYFHNISEIQILKNQYSPIGFLLQETHTNASNCPKLNGYHCVQKTSDHRNNTEGVAILIREDIEYDQINLTTHIQAIAIRVKYPINITVCSIYLHHQHYPTSNDLLNLINQLPQPLVIGGDLNAWNILWGSSYNNSNGNTIEQFIDNSNLNILNDGRPTFFSVGYQSHTAIDLTLVSPSVHHLLTWDVTNDRDDHNPIFVKFLNSFQEDIHRRSIYNLKNANWSLIMDDISFSLDMDVNSINDINSHIIEKITQAADSHLKKSSNTSPRKTVPWYSTDVASKIRHRKNALRKFKKYPTNENLQNYINARNTARKTIMDSKKQSWQNSISTIDCNTTSAEMWSKIRGIEGKTCRIKITQLIDTNDISYQNDQDICRILGEHFHKTSSSNQFTPASLNFKTSLAAKNNVLKNNIHHLNEQYNVNITFQELRAALNTCLGSSPGPDNIGYQFYTNMTDDQLEYIHKFYNKICNEGQLPEDWKSSLIIPILKPQKDKKLAANYRPISLTNCICKLYEKIISKRLSFFVESKNFDLGASVRLPQRFINTRCCRRTSNGSSKSNF